MMVTAEQKTKYYKGTNRSATYIYYRCTKKSKLKRCSQKFIRQEELDTQLSEMIKTVSLRQDWAESMLKKVDIEEQNVAQSSALFVQKIREEIKQLNVKLQFLLDSYLDQIIERDIYLQKKSDLLSQKKKLEEKIYTFEQTGKSWLGPFGEWIKDAAIAANIARGDDLNVKKVLALKIFGSDLTLSHKKARGSAQNPWNFLEKNNLSGYWERDTRIGLALQPCLPALRRRILERPKMELRAIFRSR